MILFNAFIMSAKRFYHEDYFYRASALTYTTLLAIVPLLSVIMFFITLFPWFNELILSAENYISANFIPTAAGSLEIYFQGFVDKASQLPLGSIIFLLVTAILLINTVEDTLDIIWHVKIKRRKLRSLLLCWLILIFAPIILGLSAFLTSYFLSLKWVSGITEYLGITKTIIFLSSISINAFLFALLFIIVPNTKVRWRNGILAAILTAILFELARNIFAYYVSHFLNYEVIYGAFAVFPTFLLWLYIVWCIILFGALFGRSYTVLESS